MAEQPNNLFKWGDRKLHSGATSNFFIDCDVLSYLELLAIGRQLRSLLRPYSFVESVPTGGDRLAAVMSKLRWDHGGLLIVDDVLTTGASIEEHRDKRAARGAVIFARGPSPDWVTPLFTMSTVR